VNRAGALNPGHFHIRYLYNGSAYVQPFTPTLPILTGVDIALSVYQPTYAAVQIRENSTGTILASSERRLTPDNRSYYHFPFSPPAEVTPGELHLILLFGTQASRVNIVLLAAITEKMWRGPYLRVMWPNGTMQPERPEDSILQQALAFRTYGLYSTAITTTATAASPAQSVPGFGWESIFFGLISAVALLLVGYVPI